MNLEVDSTEKQILLSALRLLYNHSVDVVEIGKITALRNKVENLKPHDRRIAVMDEEGRLYVDGEEMTESDLGL